MPVQIEELLERQNQLLELLVSQKAGATISPVNVNAARGLVPVRKHGSDLISNPPPATGSINGSPVAANVYEYRPIYDIEGPYSGFFQDGSLESALMNLMVYPTDGLAASIPVRSNNVIHNKFGFLARYDIRQSDGQAEGTGPCDPAPYLESDLDFIKMELPFGKLARAMNTMDITELILQAQANQYDQFFVVGNWRGITANMDISTFRDASSGINEGLIRAAAIRRKMHELGTFFQRWVLNKVWTGDPANASTYQTKEFYGMYRLINGKYSTSGLPIVSTSGTNTPANLVDSLSSIIVNLDNKVVGDGTWSLWRWLQDVELLLYQRAAGTGMLPVQWKIYMITPLWAQITRHLACEMVADGCTVPGGSVSTVLNLNDGGTALMTAQAQRQLEQSQSLTLNGRTYPVVLDDTMPYEIVNDDLGNFTGYKSDIFFIPFTVAGGEQALYWEYLDYSKLGPALAPIADRVLDAKGWTDGGRYWHMVTTLRKCMELQTEMQMRLIFRAPQFAARLDGIVAKSTYQYPLYLDGAGNPAGWLVPPTA